jgi:hypothetical protein
MAKPPDGVSAPHVCDATEDQIAERRFRDLEYADRADGAKLREERSGKLRAAEAIESRRPFRVFDAS